MKYIAAFLLVAFLGLSWGKTGFLGTPYIQYTTTTTVGGTITVADSKSDIVVIHEAGILAVNLNVVMPASPIDGQRVSICSVNGITTLTVSTPVGAIVSLLGTLAAGGAGTYIWSAAQSKWYRLR